jgi:hypothetical protein
MIVSFLCPQCEEYETHLSVVGTEQEHMELVQYHLGQFQIVCWSCKQFSSSEIARDLMTTNSLSDSLDNLLGYRVFVSKC